VILGHTGKLGHALAAAFAGRDRVVGRNSWDFDAQNIESVRRVVAEADPEVVINAVAMQGLDACDREPEKAFRINALFPKALAEMARDQGFLLVHFSSECVFNDEKGEAYTEDDAPAPLNVYGATKHAGDCLVRALAPRHYVFRLAIQFGAGGRRDQFVERMIRAARTGGTLRAADDVVTSPTYSADVAREVTRILEAQLPFGLYHVANEGRASLYELVTEIVAGLGLKAEVRRASHRDFPASARKNLCTPLRSAKIPPLRPWREAVGEYCRHWKLET
jgi:dTDP-4-dehydrorhamnose reductase